jgi:two-component system, sensor histidine kinase PdtaS
MPIPNGSISFFKHVNRLLMLIMLPFALILAVMSVITFLDAKQASEERIRLIAESYGAQTRLWFRGLKRLSDLGVAESTIANLDCDDLSRKLRALDPGIRAIVAQKAGRSCAVADEEAHVSRLVEEATSLANRALAPKSMDTVPLPERFAITSIAGHSLAITLSKNDVSGEWVGFFFTLDELNKTFDDFHDQANYSVLLISKSQEKVRVIAGDDARNDPWSDQEIEAVASGQILRRYSSAAVPTAYVSVGALDNGVVIVGRFRLIRELRSAIQMAIGVSLPFLIMGVLTFGFGRHVRRGLAAGVANIETVAGQHAGGDLSARAQVSRDLPTELQRVARSLNTAAAASSEREVQLQASLESNRFLQRELHHRVKNSLQVIQSDLSISRRSGSISRYSLAEAESKVAVLSSGYRHALSPEGLRWFDPSLMMNDVCRQLENALQADGHVIHLSSRPCAEISIDQALPIGLALVEIVYLIAGSGDKTRVQISLLPTRSQHSCELTVSTHSKERNAIASSRKVHALQTQAEATSLELLTPDQIIRWEIKPVGSHA